MKNIDIKSLLIGILTAGLIMVTIGAAKPTPTKETSGRFEYISVGNRGDGFPHVFCFDTADGVLYGGNDAKWEEKFGWKD